MYNDMCSSLQDHTEYLHHPKNPQCFTYRPSPTPSPTPEVTPFNTICLERGQPVFSAVGHVSFATTQLWYYKVKATTDNM